MNGNIKGEDIIVFGENNQYPNIIYNGKEIIIGFVDDLSKKYLVKKLSINIQDQITLLAETEIDDADVSDNPILLRKNTGEISIVWKNEIKGIYTICYDNNLNIIEDINTLKPPYNVADLNDYYLTSATTENAEFALAYTKKYIDTTLGLLRYDFK